MDKLCKFLGQLPLVAHNASFDKKFFENECRRAGIDFTGIDHDRQFACSMLVARRLFPRAPNHKRGTLVSHLKIRKTGQFHRALSDAEMTAQLVLAIHRKFSEDYGVTSPSHAMLRKLQRTKYADVDKTLRGFGKSHSSVKQSPRNMIPPKEFIRSDLDKEMQRKASPSHSAPKPFPKPDASGPLQKDKSGFPFLWVIVAAVILFLLIAD